MNVATHQEKENNNIGKRVKGEEKKQATDFKEEVCYLSAVVQGAAQQKHGLCKWSAREN